MILFCSENQAGITSSSSSLTDFSLIFLSLWLVSIWQVNIILIILPLLSYDWLWLINGLEIVDFIFMYFDWIMRIILIIKSLTLNSLIFLILFRRESFQLLMLNSLGCNMSVRLQNYRKNVYLIICFREVDIFKCPLHLFTK